MNLKKSLFFRILGSLKKTIAIFCFAALLLSTSSLSLYYWVQEQWHEQERFASIAAGEIIEEEHQITLQLKDKTILPDGYQWEEKGREFSHAGMFYDIVSLTKTETGWELIAASDKEEAEIVAKQTKAQHIDKELATNKKSSKQKFNFNISIFDQICASQCRQAFLQLNQIAYSNVQVRLTETSLGQISPPPEAV
ncbi:MAG: hypothetical protein KAZ20_00895 [Sediminibacterium sp.]|nr:hypothetical protein [Sediminibacterium sp.]